MEKQKFAAPLSRMFYLHSSATLAALSRIGVEPEANSMGSICRISVRQEMECHHPKSGTVARPPTQAEHYGQSTTERDNEHEEA